MKTPMSRAMLAALIAGTSLTGSVISTPAAAQFGGIVHDPRNYAQNVITAARTLEQISNQIRMLQGRATSLLNQARNLASLPASTLQELQSQIDRTRQLLSEAQRISYDVRDVQEAFGSRYSGTALSGSNAAMVANANARWKDSVSAFEDAMKVQAGIVANFEVTRRSIDTLVSASQSATGALQAAQAGNQLLALQSQQLADLTAALTAQGRAQALSAARGTAAEAEARERFRRFREKE